MFKKCIALLGALSLTGTLLLGVPASAYNVEDRVTDKAAVETMIKFCAKSYAEFQKGNTEFFTKTMNSLSKDGQTVVALVCVGYGEGFVDGMKNRYDT